MTAATAVVASCIFCNIVNKLDSTEILFEDEEVCVFRDIKPASKFHILTVPKRHIEDVKCLSADDKDLVNRMLAVSKEMVTKNNLSLSDARFGYHWPPFRSVKHLHLHTIAPESEMNFVSKLIFSKDSYWFVSNVCPACFDTLEFRFSKLHDVYSDFENHMMFIVNLKIYKWSSTFGDDFTTYIPEYVLSRL